MEKTAALDLARDTTFRMVKRMKVLEKLVQALATADQVRFEGIDGQMYEAIELTASLREALLDVNKTPDCKELADFPIFWEPGADA